MIHRLHRGSHGGHKAADVTHFLGQNERIRFFSKLTELLDVLLGNPQVHYFHAAALVNRTGDCPNTFCSCRGKQLNLSRLTFRFVDLLELKQINEAEGKAREIELLASATAEGIRTIAGAINERGGMEVVNLRVAEQYVEQFGKLAKETNTLILPQEVGNIGGFVATVTSAMQAVNHGGENQGSEAKVPVE